MSFEKLKIATKESILPVPYELKGIKCSTKKKGIKFTSDSWDSRFNINPKYPTNQVCMYRNIWHFNSIFPQWNFGYPFFSGIWSNYSTDSLRNVNLHAGCNTNFLTTWALWKKPWGLLYKILKIPPIFPSWNAIKWTIYIMMLLKLPTGYETCMTEIM